MPARRRGRRCTRARIGRVSVYFHHQAWWVYFREHGRQVRRRIGSEQPEAERVAAEINAQITRSAPSLFSFSPVSVAALRDGFLRHHEDVLRSSPATVARYGTATAHLVDFMSDQAQTAAAHEIDATSFVRFLRTRLIAPNGHAASEKRLLRDTGVQFVLEVCRSLYGYAQRQRHLPPYAPNPFADLGIDRIRVDDAKPVFVFDESTEIQFLTAARAWEFALHFTLAKTGMRPGELCHLLIDDLDLNSGWLWIRNKADLGWTIKTRNERGIPLIGELRHVLGAVISVRTSGPVFRRPCFEPTDPAFAEPDRTVLLTSLGERCQRLADELKRPITRRERIRIAKSVWRNAGAFNPDQIRRSFIRVARRCGLQEATCPKSWRHTFATLLQDANVDPLIRQITLGHKPAGGGTLGMTAVYTHSRRETQAREITRALQVWDSSLQLARELAHGGAHS